MNILSVFTGGGLVGFLVALLVIAVIFYGIKLLLAEFGGISPNIYRLIWLILIVIAVIYLLNRFAGVSI